jgi:CDP-glucose 4,6-dehydratase
VEEVIASYGRGDVLLHKTDNLHEATLLTLNIEKAAQRLDWRPRYTAQEAIQKTIAWYQAFYAEASTPADMTLLTLSQIQEYEQLLWNNNYATL